MAALKHHHIFDDLVVVSVVKVAQADGAFIGGDTTGYCRWFQTRHECLQLRSTWRTRRAACGGSLLFLEVCSLYVLDGRLERRCKAITLSVKPGKRRL